jgi:hypothetical protein
VQQQLQAADKVIHFKHLASEALFQWVSLDDSLALQDQGATGAADRP